MNRIWNWYVNFAQRRSEPVQVGLFLTTIFLFLIFVAPLLDLIEYAESYLTNLGDIDD